MSKFVLFLKKIYNDFRRKTKRCNFDCSNCTGCSINFDQYDFTIKKKTDE
ncbi:MAG: hypothetical protein K9W45_02835 [Candidatus Heimdallarchaeum aukensis]|uniref:Uncharacterized protein n=1 Tax=Candidatus Heimdallarchaeum aukensis TaxID=2876573 RepID=A0A9Y1BM34_9ARCH|nr:MAG: hypothetical protein K9W45_02835 [Candidatus Heimdallarchaeum aukensis]